jgi:hypothetical protein
VALAEQLLFGHGPKGGRGFVVAITAECDETRSHQ